MEVDSLDEFVTNAYFKVIQCFIKGDYDQRKLEILFDLRRNLGISEDTNKQLMRTATNAVRPAGKEAAARSEVANGQLPTPLPDQKVNAPPPQVPIEPLPGIPGGAGGVSEIPKPAPLPAATLPQVQEREVKEKEKPSREHRAPAVATAKAPPPSVKKSGGALQEELLGNKGMVQSKVLPREVPMGGHKAPGVGRKRGAPAPAGEEVEAEIKVATKEGRKIAKKQKVGPQPGLVVPFHTESGPEELCGRKVKRYWPQHPPYWHEGVITDYIPETQKHIITYDFMSRKEMAEEFNINLADQGSIQILDEFIDWKKVKREHLSKFRSLSSSLFFHKWLHNHKRQEPGKKSGQPAAKANRSRVVLDDDDAGDDY